MCAYMQDICSETCAKCVRKEYLSCICVQMLRILLYLPVRCVRGAELVLSLYLSGVFLDSLLVCWLWVRIQRILRNLRELWVNCAKSG